MNDQSIKWGIIGPGIIAHKMAEALVLSPDNQLIAVASKTFEKAHVFAEKYTEVKACTYAEIVEDPAVEVIYVATTHNFHFENALLALTCGKHVLVEKPFTVNGAQAEKLVKLAREKNLFLMEAIWTRFLPSVQLLRKQLREGIIGEVKMMNFTFGGFVSPRYEARLNSPDLAGGVTLDMGIYPITFATYMLDEIPMEVKSMARMSVSGVDEICTYLFRFSSGCFAQVATSFNLLMKNEALIYGMKGYIEFPNFQTGDTYTIHQHNGNKVIEKSNEVHEDNHENGFVYQITEVARCIREGLLESPIISLDETVATMKLMDNMRAEWGLKYPFE